jgi:NADH-quinone oxidoreductase subunit N
MKLDDAYAASPLIVLALAGLVCLLAVSFSKRKARLAFALCALGLLAAIASLALAIPASPRALAGLLRMDGIAFFGIAIILASSLAIALVSTRPQPGSEGEGGEYYVLLLFAALGASVLAASASLVTVFLGLELLSVSLYALIAYRRENLEASKAAFMYLILASVASAFLLFGMALAYFSTGSLELSRMAGLAAYASGAASGAASGGALLAAAYAMMGVGFAFKLAVVPFHMWAPGVYEAASAPVTALIATASKVAMAIPLIRILAPACAGAPASPVVAWTVAALSGASMIVGNLLALREQRVKRMLAGSSIAQLGYILVALVVGGRYGAGAALFYLAAYSLATLAALACVAASSSGGREAGASEDFRGLASRRPLIAAVMTASLLSLAGMPLTAGFIGKFLLFSAGMGSGGPAPQALTATRILAFLLVLNSAASLFYYLRLLSTLYRRPLGTEAPASGSAPSAEPRTPLLAGASLALLGLAILVIGTLPGPLLDLLAGFVGR